MKKEFKLGILTPMATSRFEKTDFSDPGSIDPRLKTLSAAGMQTNPDLMVTTTSMEDLRRKNMTQLDSERPNMKLIYTRDPNNKTFKMIQNITKNLTKLNNNSKANWSHRDLTKVCGFGSHNLSSFHLETIISSKQCFT